MFCFISENVFLLILKKLFVQFEKLEAASSVGKSGSSLLQSTPEMQLDDASCTLQEEETASSCEEEDSDEDFVPSKEPQKSKNSFSRRSGKNYCYVCGEGFLKITRHLKRHADEEPDIAKAVALRKNSKERKKLFGLLRNRGNYKHNQEVLRNNSGELKLKRRPTKPVTAKELLHCPYCKAMYKRNDMWRHAARCDFRTTPKAAAEGRTNVLTEIAFAESPFTQALPENVKKMLLTMKQDRIASAVQNDFLLIQLAQRLSEKCEKNPDKYDYARQKLREMGRLLLVLQEKSVLSLEDAVKPKNFCKVVEAVKDVAEFDQKMQRYHKPSLALRLGHSLKKIGNLALNSTDGNKLIITETEKFLKLCAEEWSDGSRTAPTSLTQAGNPSAVLFTQEARSSNPPSRNCCYVCGKASFKITRHLFKHRNEELDIAKAFSQPVYSKERIRLLNKLRKKGNDKLNEEPLETSCGEPNVSSEAQTSALCISCKCPHRPKSIQQHTQRCWFRKFSDVMELLQTLKKDEISSLVANDPLILQVAQHLWNTKEGKAKPETIKYNMRIMGKLLLMLRKESICSLDDAIKPQHFCKVVKAVRELARFNAETKPADIQSPKKNLGNLLQTITDSKLANALTEKADQHAVQEVKTFMKMWKEDRVVLSGVKPAPTVPFIHDVQLLYQYMETTEDSALQSLTLYESPPVYTALLRVTVAHLSVLNKNIAHVSQVLLQSFIEREEPEHHDDSAAGRSQWNQLLSKKFLKIHVRSKSGQIIPITLTPKLLAAVTLLVSKRETCGVPRNNPFLFAIPFRTQEKFFSRKQSFNIIVNRCSVKNKAVLRSLYFLKPIRRVFQALSLDAEELGELARLLGRDIRTDREYYHSPEAAVDVAKLSTLLSAMENGTLERFEGQSLEEIEISGWFMFSKPAVITLPALLPLHFLLADGCTSWCSMCKCVHIWFSFEDVLEPTVDKDSSENSDAEDAEGSESCPPTRLRANKAGNKHQYVF